MILLGKEESSERSDNGHFECVQKTRNHFIKFMYSYNSGRKFSRKCVIFELNKISHLWMLKSLKIFKFTSSDMICQDGKLWCMYSFLIIFILECIFTEREGVVISIIPTSL